MPHSPIAVELNRFREKLLDLSNFNPLLNYRKTRASTLSIVDELPDQIFKRLVTDGKRFRFQARPDDAPLNGETVDGLQPPEITLCIETPFVAAQSVELPDAPSDGAAIADRHADDKLQTDHPERVLEALIKGMGRRAATAIEETGVNYLFLALGMLAWKETEHSREQLAPLILIPVEIDRYFDGRSSRYEYAIRWREEEIQGNLCLSKRLERDFGLRLPTYENEQTPEQYFETVQREVCASRSWMVRREALLGFFSFQKLLMYLDIDPANWESSGSIESDSVVSQVIWGRDVDSCAGLYATDYAVDVDSKTKDLIVSLDADSSQHSALADIARGENLVIEGPPGTGKSQTIANAIAIAMCEGKTVLFVAEKLAALEVVHQKLASLGLADFCLELHSDAASPRQVFGSFKQRLDAKYSHPHQLEALKEELEHKKKLIADYLEASNRTAGPDKEPLYQVMWRVIDERAQGRESLRSAVFDCDITRAQFSERIQLLEAFAEALLEIENPKKSPWWGFWPNQLNPNDCRPVKEILEKLVEAHANSQSVVARINERFGRISSEWANSHLNDRTIDADIAELSNDAGELRPIGPMPILMSSQSREVANRLVEVVGELSGLESQLTNRLHAPLEQSAKSSELIVDILEKEILPRVPGGTWRTIQRLRPKLASLATVVSGICEVAELMTQQGLGKPRTMAEYEKAEFLGKLVRHPIVFNRSDVPSALFFRTAQATISRAKAASDSLQKRRSSLEECFAMEALPGAEEVIELTKRLRVYANSWFRAFSAEYRGAKRKLAEFRLPGAGKRPTQWIDNLQALGKWQSELVFFESNQEYSTALGDSFHGVETDWETCTTLLQWAATAQSRGIDHSNADKLLEKRDVDSLTTQQMNVARKQFKAELSEQILPLLGFGTVLPADVAFVELLRRVNQLIDVIDELLEVSETFSFAESTTLAESISVCRAVIRASELNRRVNDQAEWSGLDSWYRSDMRDVTSLTAALKWSERLSKLRLPTAAEETILRADLSAGLSELGQMVEHLRASEHEWQRQRRSLEEFGEIESVWLSWNPVGEDSKDVAHLISSLTRRVEILPAWSAFCRIRTQCDATGLESFSRAVLDGQVEPNQIAACYRFSVLERIAESSVWGAHALKTFSRKTIEKARHRFRELDRELLKLNRVLIAHKASLRRAPEGIGQGRVSEKTELGLIRHEIQKQQQHCRIRDLLQRAGRAAQALKPCFMMSPLSVSQFLDPSGVQFDLVVMDEASQIKPEDALGTLLRAKQLVVVGDPKQLPPTSFFDKATDDVDNDDATQFDNVESILEVAMKAFQPVRRLKWHYRSQHESLIQFSNDRFYDGELVVFPSATGAAENLGLRYHHVEGAFFENGCNVKEAEIVAKAIIDHAKRLPHETLGVGTFNAKQAGIILDCVQRLCESDAQSREAMDKLNASPEKLFVKNLENLQGDERDVIFVSYTYGPDRESGRVFNRFGPVNGKTGWRRINVLVSRARRRLEVFSSINPSDIQTGPNKSDGVNAFRDFLEYAQTGRLADRGLASGRDMESPFEEAVARVICTMGLEAVPQVGVAGYFIDLGVRRRGEQDFLLGIECDGAAFHASKSARDRDRLREEVIVSRGWKLHRVWSTDWYLNHRLEEQRLRQALEAAMITAPKSSENHSPTYTNQNGVQPIV